MYIIIGANGYLGTYFIKKIKEQTDDTIIATARSIQNLENDERLKWIEFDVTKTGDIIKLNDVLKVNSHNKIIYLAAYHHPDMVEKNPRLAWNINITALSNFLNIIENVEKFFYPSTDTVYGEGTKERKFKESDELKPINRYGEQKVVAEHLVIAYGYNVVRFPFLVSPSLVNHKKHFYDQIVEHILRGEQVEMFADSIRSSLDFGTAAELVLRLAENKSTNIPQIFNVAGDEALSKYDVGLMIAQKKGVSSNLIKPIYTEKTKGIFEVPRAKVALLDNSKLKVFLGINSIKISI